MTLKLFVTHKISLLFSMQYVLNPCSNFFSHYSRPKKRGRKPMDPELKKKLQEERKLAKKDEKAKMKLDKKSEKEAKKAAVLARKKDRLKRKDKEEKEAKARRKPGRQGIARQK